jgi:hypothetical protein
MKEVSKSNIMYLVEKAISSKQALDLELRLKKSGNIIRIKLTFQEPETFVDAKGVKWVKMYE